MFRGVDQYSNCTRILQKHKFSFEVRKTPPLIYHKKKLRGNQQHVKPSFEIIL